METKPKQADDDDDTSADEGDTEAARKLKNKMDAKLRRMCTVTSTGKLNVPRDVHELWLQHGTVRDGMVELLTECGGKKDNTLCINKYDLQYSSKHQSYFNVMSNLKQDDFLRKVETYKDTLRYRDEGTDGGFYTREDMIKKVPDGGLGWSPTLGLRYGSDLER